jgi:hypothetical protein
MTKILGILGFTVSMAATGAVTAAADDVGLINYLTGDVSYTSAGTAAKARPFMKIRTGDKFTVPSGAQMRVVYFDGGRQESFSGPAAFTAGAKQSTVQSGSQPQVVVLPSGVAQKISQTPELIQIAKLGRSGGVAVRGTGPAQRQTAQQAAEVRQARETYEQLRKSAAADDIIPEIYLYTVLQENLLYDDMKPVVAEMQKRQPKSPDVAAMVEYVKVKTETK